MKRWCTEFKAICAKTGELKTYGGEEVVAPTWKLAQEWCYENRGHLVVIGELVCEVPCKKDGYEPDWKKAVDYETASLN